MKKRSENHFTFWASELPRLAMCASSGILSAGQPSIMGEPASLGSAVHEFFEIATTKGPEKVNVDALAMKHQVDAKELDALCKGTSWDPREGEAEIRYEWTFEREEPSRTGAYKASVVSRVDWQKVADDGAVEFIDYKTTRLIDQDPEPQYDMQLVAGMLAVYHTRNWGEETPCVRATKFYVRRGDNGWSRAFQINPFNIEEYTEALYATLDAAVGQWRSRKEARYRVSDFCKYCPGASDCEGITHALNEAVEHVSVYYPDTKKVDKGTGLVIPSKVMKGEWSGDVDIENVHELRICAGVMRKHAATIDAECKAFVRTMGAVPDASTHGEKVLAFKTQHRKNSITADAIQSAAIEAGIDPQAAAKMLGVLEGHVGYKDVEVLELMDETKLADREAMEQ